MDKIVKVTLIKQQETISSIGEPIITEVSVPVWGKLSSITREEWFSAYKADFNARHRVRIYDFEYHNEPVAEVNGQRYSIYRTYYSGGDTIELYLGEKGGV